MQARRDTKRQIIAINVLLKSRSVSTERKKLLETSLTKVKASVSSNNVTSNNEEINAKRSIVSNLKGLCEVFHAFWRALESYAIDGKLTKEGHNKLNHGVQIALVGFGDFSEVQARIDNDWLYESQVFSPLDEKGFSDLLFDIIG